MKAINYALECLFSFSETPLGAVMVGSSVICLGGMLLKLVLNVKSLIFH